LHKTNSSSKSPHPSEGYANNIAYQSLHSRDKKPSGRKRSHGAGGSNQRPEEKSTTISGKEKTLQGIN